MPAGIKEQIDDLDRLLDQLLKLPIDRVQAAPATLPLKPRPVAIAAREVEQDVETPILRFEGSGEEPKPMLALADDSEWKDEEPEEVTNEKSLATEEPDAVGEQTPSINLMVHEPDSSQSQQEPSISKPLTPSPAPHPEEGSQTLTKEESNLPVEEIPWIDDEPLPNGRSKGPQVEIILRPTSNVVVASPREKSRPTMPQVKRRGWVFWIFWFVTWCFDNTFGHWFPWLRRPSVKFLMGLIGVALFAVSIYLVWTGWLR